MIWESPAARASPNKEVFVRQNGIVSFGYAVLNFQKNSHAQGKVIVKTDKRSFY